MQDILELQEMIAEDSTVDGEQEGAEASIGGEASNISILLCN